MTSNERRRQASAPVVVAKDNLKKTEMQLYNALRSSLVRLLNLLKEISMSNNLSSRQIRCVSITVSLFLGLNVDLQSFS